MKGWLFGGALCVVGIISIYLIGSPHAITAEAIRDFVRSFGSLAPLIFIILFTLTPLMPFYSALLAIAGGLIFGFGYGSLLIVIGAICASSVGFYVARYFSKWLQQVLPDRRKSALQKLLKTQEKISEHGFLMMLILRLIPLVPFDLLSYAAGFSTIKFRDYMLATILGMIPGVLVYANIGASALNVNSTAFYLSIGFLVLLTALTVMLSKALQKRLNIG